MSKKIEEARLYFPNAHFTTYEEPNHFRISISDIPQHQVEITSSIEEKQLSFNDIFDVTVIIRKRGEQ